MSNEDKQDTRVLLGTMTEQQQQTLLVGRRKVVMLEQQLEEAKSIYNALLTMAMPEGATSFDSETASWYGDDPTLELVSDTEIN